MQTPTQTTLKVRGDMRVTVRDVKTSEVLYTLTKRNTITYKGLASLIKLWSQKPSYAIADYKIAELRAGTGNTPPSREDLDLDVSPGQAIAVSDGDKIEVADDAPPTLFELQIAATMDGATGNGETYQEAGVFLSNGDMIARQTHPGIEKTALISIDYDWRFAFTA